MYNIKKFYHYYGLMSMTMQGYLTKSPIKFIVTIILFQIGFCAVSDNNIVYAITGVIAVGTATGYMVNRAEFKNYLLVPVKKAYRVISVYLFSIVNSLIFYLVGVILGLIFVAIGVLLNGYDFINIQTTESYEFWRVFAMNLLLSTGIVSSSFISDRVVRYITLTLMFICGFLICKITRM